MLLKVVAVLTSLLQAEESTLLQPEPEQTLLMRVLELT
jgi:hypothetical protein